MAADCDDEDEVEEAAASRDGSSTATDGFSDERLEGEGKGVAGVDGAAASEEDTAASWW